jgi:hypothetical protein
MTPPARRSIRVIGLIALFALAPLVRPARAQMDDVVRWLPQDPTGPRPAAQVPQNQSYFSIRLRAAYVYGQSSVLGHARSVAITSAVSVEQSADAMMVNAVRLRSGDQGEYFAIEDPLVLFAPAFPRSIRVTVAFAGLGDNLLTSLLGELTAAELKMPLRLADPAMTHGSDVSAVVRRLVARPYTTLDTTDVLRVSTSFALYDDVAADHSDALRAGTIVIVSGREGRPTDLQRLIDRYAADPQSLKMRADGQVTVIDAAGDAHPLLQNSYAVLTVEQVPLKGDEEDSAWFDHFRRAAESAHAGRADGKRPDEVTKAAYQLWSDGIVLLSADGTYLPHEREGIGALYFERIQSALQQAEMLAPAVPAPPGTGHVLTRAAAYTAELAAHPGRVVVEWPGAEGPRWQVIATATGGPQLGLADREGLVVFPSLSPGHYQFVATLPGGSAVATEALVRPGETKTVVIR